MIHTSLISFQTVVVYEHPISIQCAFVDIAYDYLKRKNVFRLMTFKYSEYLLEVQSVDEMLQWIKLIQDRGYSNDQVIDLFSVSWSGPPWTLLMHAMKDDYRREISRKGRVKNDDEVVVRWWK